MTTTFQKRQKEMKRMEKARMKTERRAQKKLEDRTTSDVPDQVLTKPIYLEEFADLEPESQA